MAYTTGSANDFSELRTALEGLLTGNGWTSAGSGNFTKDNMIVNVTSTETPASTNGVAVLAASSFYDSGAHRYWRIYIDSTTSGIANLAEVAFRTTEGGSNVISGGTPFSSSNFAIPLHQDSNAIDGNQTTTWASVNGQPSFWGYDFGSGNEKNIVEFTIQAGVLNQMPLVCRLQFSDDNVTWITKFSFAPGTWGTVAQIRTFNSSNKTLNAPGYSAILAAPSSHADVQISWPVTFHGFLQSGPNEVFLVAVDGNGIVYHVGFGDSDIPHASGNGIWQTGTVKGGVTRSSSNTAYCGCRFPSGSAETNGINKPSMMPFWAGMIWNTQNAVSPSAVLIDGTWIRSELVSSNGGTTPVTTYDLAAARYADRNLYALLPNAWNSETVLLPYQVWFYAPAFPDGVRLILDFQSLRKCRTDNLENEDIVDFAGDKWMIFSIYKKDVSNRNGTPTASGTHGIAIKYDGP